MHYYSSIVSLIHGCNRLQYSSGEVEESPAESGETATAEDHERKGLQGVLQQRNFLRNVNPRDPLNINLRRAFLEYDKDL